MIAPRGSRVSAKACFRATWAIVLALASVLGPGDAGLPGPRSASIAAAPLAAPAAAPDNSIVLQPFLSGLSGPVFITHAGDGSGRLFVVEQGGLIKVVAGREVRPTPFLDLTALVSTVNEEGLLGLAFHPNYKNNGRFFVFYTAKPPPPPSTNVGSNMLVEYRVSANPEIANPTPVHTLLEIPDRYPNHNGGNLAFGPDSFLYVGTGDEGSGGDPDDNAQNLGSLFGKLLRLDVDHFDPAHPPAPPGSFYAIPPGNPFVSLAGARPEIWAFGFRNPWRWSFDRQTGDIYVGDVGQGAWEEVDRLPAGQAGMNLGWDDREGAHCFEPMTGCLTAGRTDPILEYDHSASGGCAITGGYRYRGFANPALAGIYFYGDYCSGRIWKGISQSPNQGSWSAVEALDTSYTISSFGQDEAGELYVVVHTTGLVLRIAQPPAAPPAGCSTRPRVVLQTTRSGPGTLSVVVTATDNATLTNNQLQSVGFTRIANALVTMGSQVNQQSPFSVTLPGGTRSTQFTVQRQQAGQAFHVDLSVVDRCGPWSTFVGAGAGFN
jgi:glucose/arabinose dehydrogenase